MGFNDGVPKINSYSLTDFHHFEECPFKFYVRHHLDKKYDIDESNPAIALGSLLDQSIKKFHQAKYYGCSPEELVGLVRAAANDMILEVQRAKSRGRSHFYAATIPFLNEDIISQATVIFQNFYQELDGKIRPAIEEVGFCDYILEFEGDNFKLWGGPDTLEMGDDGIPEVVDYKSRQNIEKGKMNMDMTLMPKVYTLLMKNKLLGLGFQKARFKVRFWQEAKNEDFYEEYDLNSMNGEEFLIKQKLDRILKTKEIKFCEKHFCKACKSEKREQYLEELKKHGLIMMSVETFPEE